MFIIHALHLLILSAKKEFNSIKGSPLKNVSFYTVHFTPYLSAYALTSDVFMLTII